MRESGGSYCYLDSQAFSLAFIEYCTVAWDERDIGVNEQDAEEQDEAYTDSQVKALESRDSGLEISIRR